MLFQQLEIIAPLQYPRDPAINNWHNKLSTVCAALILCGACDPVRTIQRDYAIAMPVGEECLVAVADDLKSSEPLRTVRVLPTPSDGVRELTLTSEQAQVSWIHSMDSTRLRLLYGSKGQVSSAEIEAARSLMLAIEDSIRRVCANADSMELISERCTGTHC